MADLIDRETAYKVLTEYYHHRLEIQHKGLREALAKVPTAEPKHGRWNTVVHSNNHTTYYCPKCGSIFNKGCADLGEYKYCPNCGASMMDEVENGK